MTRRYHSGTHVKTATIGHLYFHAPCFDGMASAVLMWDFCEARCAWRSATLHPVNYEIRPQWLATTLDHPNAVVDFLYHRDADIWADHHLTTFLSDEVEQHYRNRSGPSVFYDNLSGSCAELIWHHLESSFGYRNDRYRRLVEWAAKLDAAKYRSVDEAVHARSPALRIARTLALDDDRRYATYLVKQLKEHDIAQVAAMPRVQRRLNVSQLRVKRGLRRLRESFHVLPDGILTFDVDTTDVIVNRYAPYLLAPKAPYVVGILRSADGVKVTAMRNPWLVPGVAALGKILEQFGGGGHGPVGSVVLDRKSTRLNSSHSEISRMPSSA